jgi:tetratricopeptide (TPR) repeat protein
VRNYRGPIRRTAERAGAVGVIKELHDLVDFLRRTVYLPLLDSASRSSDLPGTGSAVRLRRDLLELKRKIEVLARPPRFEDGEFPWIEEQLCSAGDALRRAAEAPASSGIDDAISALKDIVEIELTDLDRRIEAAARDLELVDLIDCLRALREELQREDLNRNRIDALDLDIEKLERVDARLSSLVKMHRAWQRVDSALNALENSLELPIEDIQRRWTLLSASMMKACPGGYEQDLPGLAAANDAFTASLEVRDKTRIGLDFPELATLLRDRFTGIDQDLLDQCERITGVGESLNTVVERLDG